MDQEADQVLLLEVTKVGQGLALLQEVGQDLAPLQEVGQAHRQAVTKVGQDLIPQRDLVHQQEVGQDLDLQQEVDQLLLQAATEVVLVLGLVQEVGPVHQQEVDEADQDLLLVVTEVGQGQVPQQKVDQAPLQAVTEVAHVLDPQREVTEADQAQEQAIEADLGHVEAGAVDRGQGLQQVVGHLHTLHLGARVAGAHLAHLLKTMPLLRISLAPVMKKKSLRALEKLM